MLDTRAMHRHGFSLIELMIAMLILVMLALAVTLSLEQLQSRSRDATRKESLQAYQIGIEQFRASNGHYLVDKQIYPTAIAGNGIPGYLGHGYGRMTRSGIVPQYPSTDSIADVLQAAGYIAKIQVDPRLQPSDIKHSDDVTVGNGFTGDYFLATCAYNSTTIITNVISSDTAKQYSLYATLENSTAVLTGTPCGSSSGSGPTETTTSQIATFNYSVGMK